MFRARLKNQNDLISGVNNQKEHFKCLELDYLAWLEGFKKISKPLKHKIKLLFDSHEIIDGLTEDSKLLLESIQTFIDTMNSLLSGIDNIYDYQKIAKSFHNHDKTNISIMSALIKRITKSDRSDLEFSKNFKSKRNMEVKKHLEYVNRFIECNLKYSISNYQFLVENHSYITKNSLPKAKHEDKKREDPGQMIKQKCDKLSKDIEIMITQNLEYFQR